MFLLENAHMEDTGKVNYSKISQYSEENYPNSRKTSPEYISGVKSL
jgi:hypothetical protein